MAVPHSLIGRGPYVHSNIRNLHFILRNSSLDNRTDLGKERMELEKNNLKTIRNNLKNATDNFLQGKTIKDLETNLLNNDFTYRGIAMEILRQPQLLKLLTPTEVTKTRQDLVGILKKDILNTVFKETDELTVKQITEKLVEIFKNKKFTENTLKEQINAIESLFASKAIKKSVSDSFKRKLKVEGKTIQKKIQELFLGKGVARINGNIAFTYFEKEFLRRVNREKIFYSQDFSPEDYLEKVKPLFLDFCSQLSHDTSNIRGSMGEELLSIVQNSDYNFDITFEAVGKRDEEDIIKAYKGDLNKMVTHHDDKKMSQTDLIITMNGKVARAQAKNLMAAYQAIINQEKIFPAIAKVQDEVKYKTLINNLQNTTHFLDEQDIKDLEYLLANELWFRLKGNYGGSKASLKQKHGGVIGVADTINRLLSKEISNFIGITITDNLEVDTKASNLFYIVSNRVLIPVYKILDGVIESLDKAANSLIKLQVTLKTSGISYVYTNPESFYKAKFPGLFGVANGDIPIKNGGYKTGTFVDKGIEQGQKIIENLFISRVNIRMDLEKILTSSYNFE